MNSKSLSKILRLLIFLIKILNNEALRYCPNYCICDLFEGRNLADCSGQRLINPYVDLSAAVEVLDLSYNDIAIIDANCFESYRYLINLTMTHNDVHTIHLDAFVKLRRLSAVDLAYNRLEYLDERLFEANHHLKLLNLEGNKFMSLPSRPFLRSISLRSLNLRNAGINSIDSEMLTALPQLMELDLSQNLLITLNVAAFNAVKHLNILQLNENRWICDAAMVKFLSILRHRGVVVNLVECDAAYREWQSQLPLRVEGGSGAHKFERLRAKENETILSNLNSTEGDHDHEDANDDDGDDKSLELNTTLNWRNLNTASRNQNSFEDEAHENDNISLDDVVGNDGDDAVDDDDEDDIIDFASYISDDNHVSRSRLSLLGIKVDEKLCDGTRENLCRRYRNCLQQVSHVLIKQMDDELTKQRTAKYTETEMYLAFIFGNVCGIAGIVFLFTCVLFVKGLCSRRTKTTNNDSEDVYETLPYVNAGTNSQPPPAPEAMPFRTRRSRRPRRQPVRVPIEHAVIQRGYEDGAGNFISRLLGRPARQQYYRATATLMRSLSRTSLFNGQRDQNNATNAPTQREQTTSSDLNTTRPETPPPQYVDIIHKQ